MPGCALGHISGLSALRATERYSLMIMSGGGAKPTVVRPPKTSINAPGLPPWDAAHLAGDVLEHVGGDPARVAVGSLSSTLRMTNPNHHG